MFKSLKPRFYSIDFYISRPFERETSEMIFWHLCNFWFHSSWKLYVILTLTSLSQFIKIDELNRIQYTLHETTKALKTGLPKGKVFFQPSISRCYVILGSVIPACSCICTPLPIFWVVPPFMIHTFLGGLSLKNPEYVLSTKTTPTKY